MVGARATAIAVESVAILVAYATLGVASARPRWLVGLAAVHGLVGLAIPPHALAVRAILAAQAVGSAGAGAALARVIRDPALAGAAATLGLLVIAFAPLPLEGFARAAGERGAPIRSAGFAACAPCAAVSASGLDLVHLPAVYRRTPFALMEMHMTRPRNTAFGWAAIGLVLLAACNNKKETPSEKTPVKAPASSAPMSSVAKSEAPASRPASGPADLQATRASIDKGVAFLVKARGADGMIGGHPGVTALAVLAIASSPDHPSKDDPRLKPSLDALAKLAKKDGSIWDKDFQTYTTALAVLAFQAAGAYPDLVAAGQKWLVSAQLDETDGIKPDNKNYGGFSYGTDPNNKGDTDDDKDTADLSNMQFAMEALHDTNFANHPEVYDRAVKFLSRCQNRSESNDQKWAGNDGGFIYTPGESKAGGTTSAGAMTYAGLRSLIYANVKKDDPRVTAAMGWLKSHYSVDEHPGLGQKGLYYYYQEMSRTLAVWGEPTFVDAAGVQHDWYGDLSRKIVSLQNPDGSWKNSDPTYWEVNPVLATARALLALEYPYPKK